MNVKRPVVEEYHDYRTFLRDHFLYLETAEPGFSLRQLSRDAKVSVGAISMFLSGQRSMTADILERLRPHLRLSQVDCAYLSQLRDLSEAPTFEAKFRILSQIQSRKGYRAQHPQEFETYHYLAHWYHVAIREMAGLQDFQWDEKWIQKRLHSFVSIDEISQALKFLEQQGFISRDKTGELQKNLNCMGGVFKLALANFHKQMLSRVDESIATVPSDERHILGHTLAVTEENAAAIKVILDEALSKIERLASPGDKPNSVVHVTLAMVPLTKKGGSGAA